MVTLELEKIGGQKPWVAKITGTDEKFGLARDFVNGIADYSRSNKPGTRGVYFNFTLGVGYYEVKGGSTWGSAGKRSFICVRDDDENDQTNPYWYKDVTLQEVLAAVVSTTVSV